MELKILKFQSFQEPIIEVPIMITKTPDNTATLKKALSAREENVIFLLTNGGKPTPSRHLLIRIAFYIALE